MEGRGSHSSSFIMKIDLRQRQPGPALDLPFEGTDMSIYFPICLSLSCHSPLPTPVSCFVLPLLLLLLFFFFFAFWENGGKLIFQPVVVQALSGSGNQNSAERLPLKVAPELVILLYWPFCLSVCLSVFLFLLSPSSPRLFRTRYCCPRHLMNSGVLEQTRRIHNT